MNKIQDQIDLQERRIVFYELVITHLEFFYRQHPGLNSNKIVERHRALLRRVYLSRQKLLDQGNSQN